MKARTVLPPGVGLDLVDPRLCVHCTAHPRDAAGFCARCGASYQITETYARRRGWCVEWELHLMAMRARAERLQPLFVTPLELLPPRAMSNACRGNEAQIGVRRERYRCDQYQQRRTRPSPGKTRRRSVLRSA